MLKVIWSSRYLRYDFGKRHPFRVREREALLQSMETKGINFKKISPRSALDKDILLVHSPNYLDRVKSLAQAGQALTPDTPLNKNILAAAYAITGGTIRTYREALQGHQSVNLLGGLHHAQTNQGGGFCIFADQAIGIKKLQQEGLIEKAMIYDLDVHAGNGTQEIFYSDPSVYNISLHQDPSTLYPGTGFPDQTGRGRGEGYNLNLTLPPGTTGIKYLEKLEEALVLYDDFSPDLLILILGTDTFRKDPLGQLRLDQQDYYKIGSAFARFKKLAVLFAGGYSNQVADLWLKFIRGLTEKK